jgi:hypothetical protein
MEDNDQLSGAQLIWVIVGLIVSAVLLVFGC